AAVLALGRARAGTAALPHSPRLLRELSGSVASGTHGAHGTTAATTVPGIDVAAYQHPDGAPINWAGVYAAGYRFAAIKATEGDYYVNPWVLSDLAVAQTAGLYVTAYHFAIPNVSGGAEQARFAVQYSDYATGAKMLPLMLDIEYDPYVSSDGTNMCYGLSATQMTAWIAAFVSTARSLTGQYPIIYTTANWWDTCTGGSTAFGADPMWVAAYGFVSPPMPAGWPAYTFWQYTSTGTVPGVDSPGTTDLDDFNTGLAGLIDPGSQQNGVGARVALQVNSLAAVASLPLTYTATGLPPGLAINGAGMISGVIGDVPGGTGDPVYDVTIKAANAAGPAGSVSFAWHINVAHQVIAGAPG
ncbi:GH25 family lysozyme, partial [Trebonia sp.]|uniref:GH25 family lysozyme n=1 Tax=Trebonia sp. TaxID=2767075 RepID=UPI00263580CE